MSFIADKVVMDGLTFDDVLLIPAYSEVLPRTVDNQVLTEHSVEYPFSFRRYGHGYRSSNGYCHSS